MKKESDNFFDRVYAVVRKIPRSRVTNYGAIADYLGTGLSARMVGWAMNAAGSASSRIPAHRVVNRNGLLTGAQHFATPTLMQELLEAEGIEVKENQVVNFKKIFWDPAVEIGVSLSKQKKLSTPPSKKKKLSQKRNI